MASPRQFVVKRWKPVGASGGTSGAVSPGIRSGAASGDGFASFVASITSETADGRGVQASARDVRSARMHEVCRDMNVLPS